MGRDDASSRGDNAPGGRSRPASALLIVAVIASVASGAHWAWVRSAASPPPEPVAGGLSVRPLVDPPLGDCRPDDTGEAGHLLFRLPEGDRLRGVEVARLFPVKHGGPELGRGVDVATTQFARGLDLRQWIRRRSPGGERFLQFVLNVERRGRSRSWAGWVRFRPGDLAHSALAVVPRPGPATRLRVVTEGGQPVPGALVFVDPPFVNPGVISVSVYTDPDGTREIEGLPEGEEFLARLVDGVGPAVGKVETGFRSPDREVLLVPQLGGRWVFVEHRLFQPLAGGSVQIAGVLSPGRSLPAAWAVSRWIGPGRGPDTPLYLMIPERCAGQRSPARIAFEGFAPADLEDARRGSRLSIDLKERRVMVRAS